MSDVLTVGIGIVILPSILLIIVPLINEILTVEVIDNINVVIHNIDILLGSTGTNLLFATIGLIVVMPLIRWILSFFSTDNKD